MNWNSIGDGLEACISQGKVWVRVEGSAGKGRPFRQIVVDRMAALFPTTTQERRKPQASRRHSWSTGNSSVRELGGQLCVHCGMIRAAIQYRSKDQWRGGRKCYSYFRTPPEHHLKPQTMGRLLATLPRAGEGAEAPPCAGPAPKDHPRIPNYNHPELLERWRSKVSEIDSETMLMHARNGRGRNCMGVRGGQGRPKPPPVESDPFKVVEKRVDHILHGGRTNSENRGPGVPPPHLEGVPLPPSVADDRGAMDQHFAGPTEPASDRSVSDPSPNETETSPA